MLIAIILVLTLIVLYNVYYKPEYLISDKLYKTMSGGYNLPYQTGVSDNYAGAMQSISNAERANYLSDITLT